MQSNKKILFCCFEDKETQPLLESQYTHLAKSKNADITLYKPANCNTFVALYRFNKRLKYLKNTGVSYNVYSRGYISTFLLLKNGFIVKYFDPRGVLPHEFIARKPFFIGILFYIIFQFIEFFNVMQSKNILCVSNGMKDYFSNKYRFIKNGSDFKLFVPMTLDTGNEKKIEKSKNLSVAYVGSTEVWQKIPDVLNLMYRITQRYPKAELHFISKDYLAVQENFEAQFSKCHQINFQAMEPSEVNYLLKEVHYGIIIRDCTLLNKVSSPIKVSEYLSNHCHVIYSGCVGDYTENLEKFSCGVSAQDFLHGRQTFESSHDIEGLIKHLRNGSVDIFNND